MSKVKKLKEIFDLLDGIHSDISSHKDMYGASQEILDMAFKVSTAKGLLNAYIQQNSEESDTLKEAFRDKNLEKISVEMKISVGDWEKLFVEEYYILIPFDADKYLKTKLPPHIENVAYDALQWAYNENESLR